MNPKKTRKEQKWFTPSFDFEIGTESKKSKIDSEASLTSEKSNVLKPSLTDCSIISNNLSEFQYENMLDQYRPVEVSDLAVQNKKVQEVSDWLKKASSQPLGNMLLLTGPSGCGKTTTVELLAGQLGLDMSEWVTPIDVEYVRDYGGNSFSFQEKQSDKFLEFLLKTSSYKSLLKNTNRKRIILVEDFPNSFIRDPSEFFDILQIYKERGKSPLIFICTDTRDGGLNMSWNLFPANIQEKYGIDRISFNSVAPTGMKQALKRITTLLQKSHSSLKVPDQDCIESIVNSSMGDIRSAVNNLHFASLKGNNIFVTPKANNAKETKGKKTKKNKENKSKLASMGKDETVTIMHGVGRVLNPKLTEKLTAKDHQRFTHSPQSIVDCFQMQPASFVSYIHENYLPHFSNIHYVERATNSLSDADCFMSEWREKFGKIYGLTVAVSGLMTANKAPVSSWHPIKGPQKGKIIYPSMQEIPLLERDQLICGKVLATDFKGFCNIISDGTVNEDNSLIEEYTICE